MANDSSTKKLAKQVMIAKRAVIYVRVSSEGQAEKASPQAQEDGCKRHCEERGYTVVKIYRDTEKYRAGKKLVDPSGTRADRPGLRQMLADGAAGEYDVIIAWREDRLYRGMRPMLDVIDCIEQNDLDIELVKETFDRRIAPVKAWAAKNGTGRQARPHDDGYGGPAGKRQNFEQQHTLWL
jgi:DNA invertase Pin-like site-specific DNA recombinase